jgi:hypothetical protein
VLAQIDERHLGPHERRGDRGAEELAPVRQRHEPGGQVDGGTEVVAAALGDLTGVRRHPYPDRRRLGPRLAT